MSNTAFPFIEDMELHTKALYNFIKGGKRKKKIAGNSRTRLLCAEINRCIVSFSGEWRTLSCWKNRSGVCSIINQLKIKRGFGWRKSIITDVT